jgi:hypothetical protein
MPNMKKAFYQIISHLKNENDHLAKILLGPACEHWLRSESSLALNFNNNDFIGLKNNEFVFEEDNKRDITFYNAKREPIRILEIKAAYPLHNSQIKDKWLNSLKNQLLNVKEGENGIKRTGLIFGIWYSDNKINISERKYYTNLRILTKSVFNKSMFTTQRDYKYESILTNYEIKWNELKYRVSIKALYLTAKKP